MRISLLVFSALGAILLFLLAQASANTSLFTEVYPILLMINGLAALALLVLVALRLGKLWRDVRHKVFGSRLKARLLGMLALMAVLPGALVYVVSMQFAVKSIDSWFDVRVDSALEGGISLARNVLDQLQHDTLSKARDIALDIGNDRLVNPAQLNRLREQAGVDTAAVVNMSGHIETASTSTMGNLLPPLPDISQLRQARNGRGIANVGEEGERLMVRALVPLSGGEFGREPRILQLTLDVPQAIADSARNVEFAQRDYQELQLASGSLKRIYTLTLTLALLLAFFAAIALAFFLAERLAEPLLILAEGTQAVAAGDFTPRAIATGSDELGVLTRSFRSMTQQLSDARHDAETRRTELEAAQAYLESVLANLSAGVLAFDTRYRLRAANKGAMTILSDDLYGFENISLESWPRHEVLARSILESFAQRGGEWQQQLEIDNDGKRQQVLLLQGTALPEAGGGGFVVVFDDISELIGAQRSAAWGEVARRLAHEIKNPLTPIQLSAERLQIKLADRLTGADRELLDRATLTIVNQVEAMKHMVNDFRDYARTPPPQLADVDLPALLDELIALYGASRAPIAVNRLSSENHAVLSAPTIDQEFPRIRADATQLRQVLHNLLSNAQDALTGVAEPLVRVELAVDGRRMRICVRDNGPGFTQEVLNRAFEPYVTTKSRGTGLGLAIVKKIVDDHGGEVRVSNVSTNGGGEISLWLPLA